MRDMKKQQAIELLGGNVTAAAKAVGVTYQAVDKWPEILSSRIRDRVEAAATRLSKQRKTRKAKAVA